MLAKHGEKLLRKG